VPDRLGTSSRRSNGRRDSAFPCGSADADARAAPGW
jgi:hypothetical protein